VCVEVLACACRCRPGENGRYGSSRARSLRRTRWTPLSEESSTALYVSPQFILKLEVALFAHVLGLLDEFPAGCVEWSRQ
jgi:hypothetical protein